MKPEAHHLATTLAILALGGACHKKPHDGADVAIGAKTGGVPTSREGQVFELGMDLALAVTTNGRGAHDVAARTFRAAEVTADIVLDHIKLDSLPATTGDVAQDGAAALHYLLDGSGKQLGVKIAHDLPASSRACYELAVKLNMIPLVYVGGDPVDAVADTMADVFAKLAAEAKLPSSDLAPIIAKLKARAPAADVVHMVFELDKTLPVSIAMIYEKDEAKPL